MWASDILALNEVILLKSISVNERQRFICLSVMKNPDKHVQFSFVKSQSNIFSIFGQDRLLSDLSLRSQSTIDVRLHLHDLDRHVTSLYVYLFICYF